MLRASATDPAVGSSNSAPLLETSISTKAVADVALLPAEIGSTARDLMLVT
jgi:hypothetical protein